MTDLSTEVLLPPSPAGGPLHSPVHTATAGREAGPGAAVIGDPLALGLASFGVAVGVIGVTNTGLLDPASTPVAYTAIFASGFFTLLIAGVLAFRRGETFVGVIFTSWCGFFLGIGLLLTVYAPAIATAGGSAGAIGAAFGVYLLAWALISTYHWIAALVTTKMNGVVFGFGTLALYVLGIAAFMGSRLWTEIGGWLQVAVGIGLLYQSAATMVNEMHGRRIVPIG